MTHQATSPAQVLIDSVKISAQPVEWGHHEENPDGEDHMTEDGLFEALMDTTYGHYNIYRTDWEMTQHELETLSDTLIAQVRNLKEATPALQSYLAKREEELVA
jgi:hypothetical protein